MSSHSLVINYLSIICPYLFTIKSPWNYPGNQTRQCNQNIHLLQQFKHIWIYGKRPLQGLPWSHWRLPCCLHILWMKSMSCHLKNTGKYTDYAVKCSWENYIKMNEWHEFNDKEHFYIESQKLASKSSPSKKSLWRSTCNLDNEQNTNHWM
jgi:hypothetical protein